MGNPVPSWLLSSFFRLGLNPDLEPYTFQMVNTARTQKRELEIDEMIIALVDHDRRQQFSEDVKALAAKRGKANLLQRRKSQSHRQLHRHQRRRIKERNVANTMDPHATLKNRVIT